MKANGHFDSDWLSMIYPRLKIARNFLSDSGAIFINIGEDEVDSLRKVSEEVFGRENFVAQVTRVAKRTSDKGTHFDRDVTVELVKDLASYKPLRVVFRDNGFVSDAVKINVEQIFCQLSPTTEVKAL